MQAEARPHLTRAPCILADYSYAITGFGALHDYQDWLYDAGTLPIAANTTCPGPSDAVAFNHPYTHGDAGTADNACMNPPGNGPGFPGTYQSYKGQALGDFQGNFATNNSTTSIARPSETVVTSDGPTQVQTDSNGNPDFTLYMWPGGGDAVHNGGGNYGFADGHAKRITLNPLNYVQLSSNGGYYIMTYFTMSE